MELTDKRKTAKNLVKKKLSPRFATFKGGTKLTYGCVFHFTASVPPFAS